MSSKNLNTPKRKKNELSIEQKREICIYWKEYGKGNNNNSRLTQKHVQEHFSKQFQVIIGKTTIHDILKASDVLINFDTTSNPDQVRIRGAKYPELEEALYLWFCEMRAIQAPIDNSMLIQKAEYFAQMLTDQDGLPMIDPKFKFSGGWIEGFRERHFITFKHLHGEGGSCEKSEIMKNREELKAITAQYLPEDIYNADEFATFYKLLPNRTLADKNNRDERGIKTNVERITGMVCCNSDGSDRTRLLVIHKFKNPHCFSRTRFDPNTIVDYYYNSSAWMTQQIFSSWLLKFSEYIKSTSKPNRKVLLLIDNCSGHVGAQNLSNLANVQVHFLPPNTTSHLQPCDAGIIRSLKSKKKVFITCNKFCDYLFLFKFF
jgi:hypothetical protein